MLLQRNVSRKKIPELKNGLFTTAGSRKECTKDSLAPAGLQPIYFCSYVARESLNIWLFFLESTNNLHFVSGWVDGESWTTVSSACVSAIHFYIHFISI